MKRRSRMAAPASAVAPTPFQLVAGTKSWISGFVGIRWPGREDGPTFIAIKKEFTVSSSNSAITGEHGLDPAQGQLIRVNRIGGSEATWDARGMLVEERSDDYFRHYLLGLGSGDVTLTTSGARNETIWIPNVVFADHKVDMIQRLVAVEPSRLMPDPARNGAVRTRK